MSVNVNFDHSTLFYWKPFSGKPQS